jgi:rod shape-determining protein MreB
MIVDIGGGTTEVAIISLSCIVACNSVKCGGDGMDSAIINYMSKKHNLLIGPNWAERIKIQIGSAYPLEEKLTMEVKGMDYGRQGDRLPRAVIIDSDEIREALSEPVSNIVKTIRKAIDTAPPELAARLIDNGITLAGGGSMLRGLDRLIAENTSLHTRLAENPLQAVVNGTSKLLENASELFGQPQNSLIGSGERQ